MKSKLNKIVFSWGEGAKIKKQVDNDHNRNEDHEVYLPNVENLALNWFDDKKIYKNYLKSFPWDCFWFWEKNFFYLFIKIGRGTFFPFGYFVPTSQKQHSIL